MRKACPLRTRGAAWFSEKISETDAPWAFERSGEPYRMIAALEGLAALVGMMLFIPVVSGGRLRGSITHSATGYTDKQGEQLPD